MTTPDAGPNDLRTAVTQAWTELVTVVDGLMASGRLPHGEVLVDMARFLESAMPAVRAYERAAAHLEQS